VSDDTIESAGMALGELLSQVASIEADLCAVGVADGCLIVYVSKNADASAVPSKFRGFEVKVIEVGSPEV
jgi:hypothetical protein